MCRDYPLIQAESIEPILPREPFMRLEQIKDTSLVCSTGAAIYYMDWLIADLAYLECVLEDTLLPRDIAARFAGRIRSRGERGSYVLDFLKFLQDREEYERAAWDYRGSQELIVPDLMRRLGEQQKVWLATQKGRG